MISADETIDVNGTGIENMAMLIHVNEMTAIVCVSSVGVWGGSWHTGY